MMEGRGRVQEKRQRESSGVNGKDFPAVLAHELRNPLAGVVAHMDLLREMMDPEDPRTECLDAMEGEVRRMERVLASLLEYSRRGKPRLRPVRAGLFLENLVESFREKSRQKGVRLLLEVEPGLGTARMDPDLMERVLGNLLDNAIRAVEAGKGRVHLSARRGEGSLVISCRDNGPGVLPEERERIFEPFFTRSPKGLGLGLPLARKIVEEHGGTLTLDSAPGKGAQFTLVLPSAREGEDEEKAVLEVAHGALVAR